MTPYRARLYRLIFAAAAVYNLAFGLWAALFPRDFFRRCAMAPPTYPSIWACLGMVVGVYGLGYAYAAWRLDRAAPFVAIGLLGKLLGPAGWLLAVSHGEWPVRTVTLILFNDVIWWLPFGLFLLEGTRLAAAVRAAAPYVCAAANFAAILTMAAVLRPGTEVVPAVADRVAYIARHPALWRGGWAVWIAAALSLVAFYAWWGSRLRRPAWAVAAVGVAAAGLVCDLFAESLGFAVEVEDGGGATQAAGFVHASHSYVVAVAPAVLAARAIKAGTFAASGLVPADRQVDPDELVDYLGRAGVRFFRSGS